MHIYGKDQQAFHLSRTRAEKWFSRVNTLLVAVQLACFLCAIIRTAINVSSSMSNAFFVNSKLDLKEPFLVKGCVYNVTRTHAFFSDVTFMMSPSNVGYFVSRGAQNIRYMLAISGVQVVVSIVNRAWFETNTAEIRYHFVVFRKDMVTMWEIWLIVLGLVVTFGLNEENSIMQSYLEYCNKDPTMSKGFYSSTPPYVELYVSYFVTAGVYVINIVVACFNMFKQNPRVQLMKEEETRQKEEEERMQREREALDSNTLPKPQVTYGGNVAQINTDSQSNPGAVPPPQFFGTAPPPPPLRSQRSSRTLGKEQSVSIPLTPMLENQFSDNGDGNYYGKSNNNNTNGRGIVYADDRLGNNDEPSYDDTHDAYNGGRSGNPAHMAYYDDENYTHDDEHLFSGEPGDVDNNAGTSQGLFELHEVGDDDDDNGEYEGDVLADAPASPLAPPPPSTGGRLRPPLQSGDGGRQAPESRQKQSLDSDVSTPLLVNRIGVIPPPPPVLTSDGVTLASPSPRPLKAPQVTDDNV